MGFHSGGIKKDLYPGLPIWQTLKDCHGAFAASDSYGKGRWLECPQSWFFDVMPNRLKGFGLDGNWVIKFTGSANGLWTKLKSVG